MSFPSSHRHGSDRLDLGVGPTSPDSKHRCACRSSFSQEGTGGCGE